MALQVSSNAQLVFFNKIFGPNHPTTNRVKGLQSVGVTFEVALYAIRAFLKGKALGQVQLTYGTTPLMKGTADPIIANQNKHLIEEWTAKLYQEQGSPKAQEAASQATAYKVMLLGVTHPLPHLLKLIKAVHSITGGTVALAKQKVDDAMAGTPVVVGMFSSLEGANIAAETLKQAEGHVELHPVTTPVVLPQGGVPGPYSWAKETKPVPVPEVIHLKAAQALGQQVHGTSSGSVYYTIALTDHVKLAARLYKTGSISIRAEWTDDPKDDLKKLQEAGLQMKANYGSLHFDAADVPPQRVIGAFLMGTGIDWKASVKSGAELVIGEMK